MRKSNQLPIIIHASLFEKEALKFDYLFPIQCKGATMTSVSGVISICFWFEENPSSGQESGPPIPNYFLQCYENQKFVGSGYTAADGCLSLPYESNWHGSNGEFLSFRCNYHDGEIGISAYSSEHPAVKDIDLGDRSSRWLPPKNVPLWDCSTCDVYYADANIATYESLGGSSPLTTHECSTNDWGLNCCGYDYQTQRCGVQEFFPEFSFLHPCGGCADFELDSSDYPCTINQRNCMDTDIISGKPSSNGTLTSAALVGIIASSSVVALILLIFGICKWKRSKAKHHNEIKMNNAQQQDHQFP